MQGFVSPVARAVFTGLSRLALAVRGSRRDIARSPDDSASQTALIREQAAAIAHYRKVIDCSSAQAKIGVWECDLTDETLTWSDGTYDLFEIPRGAPITRAQILACYDFESRQQMKRLRAKAIAERSGFALDIRIKTAKGNDRWIRLTGNVECEHDVPVRIFGLKQDITAERALLDRLRLLAESDLLTGLSNRSLLQARLISRPESDGDEGQVGALLLIDLDGFKQINDTFGHSAGDECLKQVAARLRRVCRTDLVARMGGDEFAIVMNAGHGRDEIVARADAVLAALRDPVGWQDHIFQLGGSIGIAIMEDLDPYDGSELFVAADLALYAAKADGRNRSRIFTPDLKTRADARFNTIRAIAAALADAQLALFYQPKLHLAGERLSGFEALLRWRQPDGRVVSAAEFEVVFDDPQLSTRIGEWVVATAVRQASDWQRAGFDFGHIAINLSAVQFRDAAFADQLVIQIAAHGLRPDMIQVEVTESVFLTQNPGLVMTTLKRLRDGGIRIALDDFGTGYASLVHLRTFPIDVIKIDKSFVRHFLTSTQDRAILEATLKLGHDLGLDVVAEGIETREHLECLKLLGCRFGQGYLFAEALPGPAVSNWCRPPTDDTLRVA